MPQGSYAAVRGYVQSQYNVFGLVFLFDVTDNCSCFLQMRACV